MFIVPSRKTPMANIGMCPSYKFETRQSSDAHFRKYNEMGENKL